MPLRHQIVALLALLAQAQRREDSATLRKLAGLTAASSVRNLLVLDAVQVVKHLQKSQRAKHAQVSMLFQIVLLSRLLLLCDPLTSMNLMLKLLMDVGDATTTALLSRALTSLW